MSGLDERFRALAQACEDLTDWLLEQGIESMSLNPDTVVDTWLRLAGQTVD